MRVAPQEIWATICVAAVAMLVEMMPFNDLSVFEGIWIWFNAHIVTILAVLALFGTAFQAHAARVQNRRSVQPLLSATIQDFSETGEIRVYLMNVGLGPAIIEKYAIRYAGRDYEGAAIFQLFDKVIEGEWGIKCKARCYLPNGGFGANTQEAALTLFVEPYVGFPEPYQTKLSTTFSIEIEYRSMQGEKFLYSSARHRWDHFSSLKCD